MRYRLWTLGIVALATAGRLQADEAPMMSAVVACKAETDASKRLACYDQAVNSLSEAVASGNVAIVTRDEVRKTQRSLFGFGVPELPFLKGKKEEPITEIASSIKSVRSQGYGNYILVLEDGAQWRTLQPTLRTPRPGAEVRIKAAALGSYMMNIDGARAVRVKRTG